MTNLMGCSAMRCVYQCVLQKAEMAGLTYPQSSQSLDVASPKQGSFLQVRHTPKDLAIGSGLLTALTASGQQILKGDLRSIESPCILQSTFGGILIHSSIFVQIAGSLGCE